LPLFSLCRVSRCFNLRTRQHQRLLPNLADRRFGKPWHRGSAATPPCAFRQAAQPHDLLLIHRRLPHHSALNEPALSTPIGDRNRSRLIGFRLASHDDHRDVALRTWGRELQVARKLNNVISLLTRPTARSHRCRLRWRNVLRPMTFLHKLGAALSSIRGAWQRW
jgi:hypothetical protein